ncbi:MAG: hypothetical protein OEM82_10950 [Acidobacteriota bacterium]|nr:hypothetical protein [Acidobacteriota bacterium]MDH3529094.1 hypothetical protein [Acidobacteriota bacterium]
MRSIGLIFTIIFICSGQVQAKFNFPTIEEAVESADLVVIGTLRFNSTRVLETQIEHQGVIEVEAWLFGSLSDEKRRTSSIRNEVAVSWFDSTIFACRYEPPKNKKGIWLIRYAEEPMVLALYPGSFFELGNRGKVEQLIGDSAKIPDSFLSDKLAAKPPNTLRLDGFRGLWQFETGFVSIDGWSFTRALIVILIAIFLYQFLFKDRIRIKVKNEKKKA